MAMVVVDDSCLQADSQPVRWLGLRVGGRLAPFYVHHMNRVNFRNDLVVMMTALVMVIIIFLNPR